MFTRRVFIALFCFQNNLPRCHSWFLSFQKDFEVPLEVRKGDDVNESDRLASSLPPRNRVGSGWKGGTGHAMEMDFRVGNRSRAQETADRDPWILRILRDEEAKRGPDDGRLSFGAVRFSRASSARFLCGMSSDMGTSDMGDTAMMITERDWDGFSSWNGTQPIRFVLAHETFWNHIRLSPATASWLTTLSHVPTIDVPIDDFSRQAQGLPRVYHCSCSPQTKVIHSVRFFHFVFDDNLLLTESSEKSFIFPTSWH